MRSLRFGIQFRRNFSSGSSFNAELLSSAAKREFISRLEGRRSTQVIKGPPKSAVLVPLLMVGNQPSVLFTVRSATLNSHRGEISFPGGNIDKGDLDPVSAALRETEEEIGIDQGDIEVWGALPATFGRDGQSPIVPVVGVIKAGGEGLITSLRKSVEVAEVFSESLETLCDAKRQFYTQFRSPTGGYSIPVFLASTRRIWGITAMILHSTLLTLVPQHYQPTIRFIKPTAISQQ